MNFCTNFDLENQRQIQRQISFTFIDMWPIVNAIVVRSKTAQTYRMSYIECTDFYGTKGKGFILKGGTHHG